MGVIVHHIHHPAHTQREGMVHQDLRILRGEVCLRILLTTNFDKLAKTWSVLEIIIIFKYYNV